MLFQNYVHSCGFCTVSRRTVHAQVSCRSFFGTQGSFFLFILVPGLGSCEEEEWSHIAVSSITIKGEIIRVCSFKEINNYEKKLVEMGKILKSLPIYFALSL